MDRQAIRRALAAAADVELDGRVVPVVRSRAAGISRAASLHDKVRLWARATGCLDVPLLERLDVLAHQEPAAIAASILAGDEVDASEHEVAPAEVAAGHRRRLGDQLSTYWRDLMP